jgi:hypothetical protein
MLTLLTIEKSPAKFKKYRADVLLDGVKYTGVDFGDTRYEHFKDSTPLKLYSHLDHNDTKRLHNFYLRHKNNNGVAGLLSKKYLW